MKRLSPNETKLVGKWLADGAGHLVPDETSDRIEWLVIHCLVELGFSKHFGAWETLFLDPSDGRLWERTYPQGHLQGGGPPSLKTIDIDRAEQKYDIT